MYNDKHPQTIHVQRKLQYIAKQLRQQPTVAEVMIWTHIKSKKVNGHKFRRQYPLYTFIVDFYCHELKLIIEIDGKIHDTQRNRDLERDRFLWLRGYTTLRFSNEEVFNNLEHVIKMLHTKIPSLQRGGKASRQRSREG